MKSIAIALFSTLISFSVPVMANEPRSICPAVLETEINAIALDPKFSRSRWGIMVESLDSGQVLYSLDSERFFLPASTIKLLTTVASIETLGPDFRIRTSVYSSGNGNVYIVGRGDPTITNTELESLAQQLRDRGISQIDTLVAKDGYFPGMTVNPNWEWEDVQAGYGAPVNSLILHQNSLDLKLWPTENVGQPLRVTWVRPEQGIGWQIDNQTRTVSTTEPEFVAIGRSFTEPIIRVSGQLHIGAEPENVFAAVVNPGANFLEGFTTILSQQEISVNRGILANYSQRSEPEVAWVESPPLSELVKTLNMQSNNVFAEAIVRTLGVQRPSLDAASSGLNMIAEVLDNLGVSRSGYVLRDGSGLSRHNLATPQVLVATLRVMWNSPHWEIYQDAIPVAGVSGTLERRFQNTPAQGQVWAKTGTMRGMSSLAGYVKSESYSPLVFAIIVNQSNLSTQELREAIDRIVVLLSSLQPCD
ncbi:MULTISPECIES: D-alanyl-D-alanine carboxypeptidase/D-alanyl-D-alanine endopeptidase [Limnospira]|uniref:D-alanyl-D-alanine carboxypeptidase/D-alanyl-D-alanine-endopeptidas n=3 Tax=Limnospira TaxID=2596745 RepID=A0A9P1KJA9_9CYAN|nr:MULTISPECIES: D-alanyl-D-alanine carboxypeptidase/D-alanyl-D-alanine-endopeptidase [Limnospira]EDZ95264.1 D-alanyl-D-alanine carboxypeptidase/D-alanyl-D-alanine-endopeptidase [Limnospira maxima CS-328]MDC0838052.1 D-alanyl-D-alanine carboxypeptidase/D-alanyl-D-alanine-endopeptidase [Limnoraphis robusta]MDY7051069.1 D-alanyl-D-alanine carboxypeptidase/D-alanyl-D-alanine-endopeptidase [Limnospira fusiformis LS22]QJB29267.1 D-alanyl-D-alanine carboxypeptidase/D-alanyl-D-alanine-endopeptidase [L